MCLFYLCIILLHGHWVFNYIADMLLLSFCILLLTSSFCDACLYQIQAPPKVTNVKIIGELRESNKITVTGIVTGGTEGSSRVQWFKTRLSILDGEKDLEALSASKIAKVGDANFL